jgi:hypothetical protein
MSAQSSILSPPVGTATARETVGTGLGAIDRRDRKTFCLIPARKTYFVTGAKTRLKAMDYKASKSKLHNIH